VAFVVSGRFRSAVAAPRGALRAAVRAVAGPPVPDLALSWRGTAPPLPGGPLLRIAHYGDCGWREMPYSHGVHTRPGYPLVLADRLAQAGAGLEFSSVVANRFDHLPGGEELDVHLRLSGPPDVVLVQLGGLYPRLVLIPDRPLILRLRARIARRLGPLVFAAYRALRPFVIAAGRFSVPYGGPEPLVGFLHAARARWPDARVVVMPPFPRSSGARRQLAIEHRVAEDVRAAATGIAGVELLKVADLLPRRERGLRCANAYNLSARGGERIGHRLADFLASPHPAAENRHDPATKSALPVAHGAHDPREPVSHDRSHTRPRSGPPALL
jgi:hypothetical protein